MAPGGLTVKPLLLPGVTSAYVLKASSSVGVQCHQLGTGGKNRTVGHRAERAFSGDPFGYYTEVAIHKGTRVFIQATAESPLDLKGTYF